MISSQGRNQFVWGSCHEHSSALMRSSGRYGGEGLSQWGYHSMVGPVVLVAGEEAADLGARQLVGD